MMSDGFGVLIISAGRPNNVRTLDTLEEAGCSDPVLIVCDDEDDSLPEYKKRFGDMVRVFDVSEYAKRTDRMACDERRRCAVYARNACWDVARAEGWSDFLVLDDDTLRFRYREADIKYTGPVFTKNIKIKDNISGVFACIRGFLDGCDDRVKGVAMAQGGDYIGGADAFVRRLKSPRRKCMNSWFLRTDVRFDYMGGMNDDETTGLVYGEIGGVFLTIPYLVLEQPASQAVTGGLSELYINTGTYQKTMYSVMARPDCVVCAPMGRADMRLHHRVNWKYAVPKIVPVKPVDEEGVPCVS